MARLIQAGPGKRPSGGFPFTVDMSSDLQVQQRMYDWLVDHGLPADAGVVAVDVFEDAIHVTTYVKGPDGSYIPDLRGEPMQEVHRIPAIDAYAGGFF